MSMIRSMRGGLLACLAAATVSSQGRAAEVRKIGPEQAGSLPRGKEADAIAGDYLLRNDKVAATIGGVATIREANVNTQAVQGAVLDLVRLDLPGGDNDLLDAFYPHGHYLDAPGPTVVAILRADGVEATLRFSRAGVPGMQGDPVDVQTDYTLRDGEPFLRVVTTYRNRGSEVAQAAIYDKIRADKPFAIPPAGDTASLIYDERWHGAAYGVVRAGGGLIRSYANPPEKTYFLEGGNRLDFPDLLAKGSRDLGKFLPAPSPVPAGGEVVVKRFLIPGRHVADVQAVVAALLDQEATIVPVRVVVAAEGGPIPGAIVRALVGKAVRSEGRADADGRVDLVLAEPGDYEIVATDRGRVEARTRVTIPNPGREPISLPLGLLSEATFAITEGGRRGPVRAMIAGVEGTPDPNFGPDMLPGQAGRLCFSATGSFSVPLPPGRYEATFGRGPEFAREIRRFVVDYGQPATVTADIPRAFATPGWVIGDFHNHTTASNDSIADTRGRVVGIAAAGVEFAPATEHNRISTFAPAIAAEGLGNFLQSAGGIELSGRPGPGALNHQNGFPLVVRDGIEGGGAPRTDKDPKIQIGRLFHLDDDSEKFVQQNHPDVGWLFFDKDRDGRLDGGFGTRPFTHAIELNRGISSLLKQVELTDPGATRGTPFRWLQMLNQGDRIYGTANSDAHVTAFNNGSIFTYIQSDVDAPARLDPAALARSARLGRMVLSNGPFLDVSADGVPPGGDVSGGHPTLTVRVLCAPEIDIDRVQILVNGRPDPALNWTRATHPDAFAPTSGPLRFERSIPLALTTDAHLIVIATGEQSRLGPWHGPYANQPPTAVSNPIFLDVDGGGFAANHDTLGVPLPVASPSGAEPAEAD